MERGEFMEQMRECDLEILNGGGQGRRVTYIGTRGSTVIDYMYICE